MFEVTHIYRESPGLYTDTQVNGFATIKQMTDLAADPNISSSAYVSESKTCLQVL